MYPVAFSATSWMHPSCSSLIPCPLIPCELITGIWEMENYDVGRCSPFLSKFCSTRWDHLVASSPVTSNVVSPVERSLCCRRVSWSQNSSVAARWTLSRHCITLYILLEVWTMETRLEWIHEFKYDAVWSQTGALRWTIVGPSRCLLSGHRRWIVVHTLEL